MAGNKPGLLNYFEPCRKNMNQILLPDPTSPLSDKVDSSVIKWPKAEVAAVLVSASAILVSRGQTAFFLLYWVGKKSYMQKGKEIEG